MSGINERRVREAEAALDKLLEHGGTEKQILAAYCALEVDAKAGMAWPQKVGFVEVEAALRNAAEATPKGLRQRAERAERDKYRHLGRASQAKVQTERGCCSQPAVPEYVPIVCYREPAGLERSDGLCVRYRRGGYSV
jgi:hypothetical protein